MPDRAPDIDAVRSPPPTGLDPEALRVGDRLGSGGRAVVREAAVVGDGPVDRVALKEPADGGATVDRASAAAFAAEAETWTDLKAAERERPRWAESEFVVGVVDVGDNLPWIAMEYMDGGSLADRLDAGALPPAEAAWVAECVARAVELAHNEGVAHCDLKPSNVLLRATPNGEWPLPKVADWGLSRPLGDGAAGTGLSVPWAAPEQFDERPGVPDALTDVYQVGAVLYAALVGAPPHGTSRVGAKRSILAADAAPRPSEAADRPIPDALDQIAARALAPGKAERYRAAAGLVEDLAAARRELADEPSAADGSDAAAPTASAAGASDETPDNGTVVIGVGKTGARADARVREAGVDARTVTVDVRAGVALSRRGAIGDDPPERLLVVGDRDGGTTPDHVEAANRLGWPVGEDPTILSVPVVEAGGSFDPPTDLDHAGGATAPVAADIVAANLGDDLPESADPDAVAREVAVETVAALAALAADDDAAAAFERVVDAGPLAALRVGEVPADGDAAALVADALDYPLDDADPTTASAALAAVVEPDDGGPSTRAVGDALGERVDADLAAYRVGSAGERVDRPRLVALLGGVDAGKGAADDAEQAAAGDATGASGVDERADPRARVDDPVHAGVDPADRAMLRRSLRGFDGTVAQPVVADELGWDDERVEAVLAALADDGIVLRFEGYAGPEVLVLTVDPDAETAWIP